MTGRFGRWTGVAPTIAPDAWVAPTAAVIGDVVLEAGVSVWWRCVLRGDTNAIRVGEGSNIQDGSILHVNRERFPCLIGRNVTVGHACIVHACTLEDRAFVGMGGHRAGRRGDRGGRHAGCGRVADAGASGSAAASCGPAAPLG